MLLIARIQKSITSIRENTKEKKNKMDKYFLPFNPSAKVDYLFLIRLYEIAGFDKDKKVFNIIKYTSVKQLSTILDTSTATINRIFSNTEYNLFFYVNKKDKTITLQNNFKNVQSNIPFVVLSNKEVCLIKQVNENLFAKYLIYLRYYCNYSKSKEQDFTGNQFLRACGYSDNSHSYLAKLSSYNSILKTNDIISIRRYRDDLGHTRNIYKNK